jgi:hypothetical protein
VDEILLKSFLVEMLGEEAGKAISTACKKSPHFSNFIPARVTMSWIGIMDDYGYTGVIPGVPNSSLSFSKSEDNSLSGYVNVGNDFYEFSKADCGELAALITVMMGVRPDPLAKTIKTSDLASLGSSIDRLVKSRIVNLIKKGMEAGGFAKPQGPIAPEEPTEKQKDPQVKKVVPPKSSRQMSVTKAESETKCSVCGSVSFRGDRFTGCRCTKDLAKEVTVIKTEAGFTLSFDSNSSWTDNNILVLSDILGVRHG